MNNENSNILIIDKISKYVPVFLSFLIPLFFLPTTSEFFEYNKFTLILLATIVLGILWTIRLILGQKIELVKSSSDLPLIALTVVIAISTIFSINKTSSIFGSQGRWFPGLFPALAFIAYYFLATPAVKEITTIKNSILAFIAGATATTVVTLLSYYNVFFSDAPYMRVSNFTPAGSTLNAVVIAAVALVAGFTMLAYEDKLAFRIGLMVTAIVNFFVVALLGLTVGWVILGVGACAIFVMVDLTRFSKARVEFMVFSGALLAILLVNVVPNTKAILQNPNFSNEVSLSFNDSWIVATSTIRDYPLLATGPSTFYLNYPRYKSLAINNTNLWNVRFDKPTNELLNTMSTLGIIGLAAALWAFTKVGKIALASKNIKDETGMLKVVSVVLIATLPVFVLTYATVLNTFIVMQFLVLVIAAQAATHELNKEAELVSINFASFASVTTIGETSIKKREYFHYVAAAPMIVLMAYAGFVFYKTYAAEYYIRESVIAAQNNLGAKVYEYQGKAINFNPQRDAYQTAYAQTNLALANALSSKADLNDQDRQTIQTLIAQSIRSARVSTEVQNPLNVVNWQTRALIYRSILNVADNAAEWAIASYNTAMQLDPSNPALRLDLGGIYFAKNDFLSAANYFRQATALKPDYANAHYNFAQALLKLNDPQNAYKELETTKSLLDKTSADYTKVEQELAALSTQPAVAGAGTQKPTVEQLTGTTTTTTPQEPLAPAANTTTTTPALNLVPTTPVQPTVTVTPTPVRPTPTPVVIAPKQ